MPKCNWRILIAFVGWLSLANAQSPRAKSKQPETQSNQTNAVPPGTPPSAPVKPVEPPKLERACDEGKDARDSDLCAQWKAADAARDAADWTRLGIILGVFGTVGLFWTLYYTRKAVLAAEEATKGADDALATANRSADASARLASISEEHGQLSLRAYVSVTDIKFRADQPGELWAEVTIQNKGSTAALELQGDFTLVIVEGNSWDGPPGAFAPRGVKRILAAGEPLILESGNSVAPYQPKDIIDGDWTLGVVGAVGYDDIFGKSHVTNFRYHWRGRFRANGRPIEPTETGNEMT